MHAVKINPQMKLWNAASDPPIHLNTMRSMLPIPRPCAKTLNARYHTWRQPTIRAPPSTTRVWPFIRSEEHTSELQSHSDLVCRLLLEKKTVRRINETSPNDPCET